MSELNSQQQFDNIVQKYLEQLQDVKSRLEGEPELEIRFGTKGIKSITLIEFNNVIRKLKSLGFEGSYDSYSLKMSSEFTDKNTGQTKESNIRVELNGLNNIQSYCNSNKLTNNMFPQFNQKSFYKNDKNENIRPVNINDFNLRISLQKEKPIKLHSSFAQNIISEWTNNKKTFRYINRISFKHSQFPIRIDMSIVKESNTEEYEFRGRKQIRLKPEYTIETSNVFNNTEKYEIELEVLNYKVGAATNFSNSKLLSPVLRKIIKFVLSGLQNTNYPISYTDIQNIGIEYLKTINGKDYNEKMRMLPKFFPGPGSTTLQIRNIAPINEDANIPNIRNNYTVTDKADGIRKLLYIAQTGKIYLIDTNMNIQFTGAITKNVELKETILDGEHILHNKKGEFINLYAAFDIYIINKKNVRSNSFIPLEDENNPVLNKYRLPLLVNVIQQLNPISVVNEGLSPIRIENKKFKAENINQSIFQCCYTILLQKDTFEYNIDGLIFTPATFGVGGSAEGESAPIKKVTWEYSFKWKPPEFNTIDFLVTTKKDVNGDDFIGNIFQEGTNAKAYEQLSQYKTLILRVGFDESKHGYVNPCGDVIQDKLPKPSDIDNEDTYKPLQFFPSDPSDVNAGICNVMLQKDKQDNNVLMTEEDNEVFTDGMIVEFKYDLSKEPKWRWVPLRVRYDKTEEFRKGFPMYGNAYHVANSNWHSIHNPITNEMISTGENIPDELADDDVYYNKISGTSKTEGLRDFHNLFVKKLLITSISQKGNTLIDYAVGMGGDFPKWIAAKLSFVFGIDISKDNIENRIRGACARYLNYRKKFKVMPACLFIQGNSSYNIKNGEAQYTEQAKQITRAIFGEGSKEKDKLGLGVYKQYGKGVDGFNISSCQFAIHYFFENKKTLNNFLRNVSECTKVGGYFVGACYNGDVIFNALRGIKQSESISIMEDKSKILQITKGYDQTSFQPNETSLGYSIDVFQETINQTIREYLVNFDYLNRMMENYGFSLLSNEECKNISISHSVRSFQQLYSLMEDEIKINPKNKNKYGMAFKMTPKEKQISFYNNYFIYKKIRNVDITSVYNGLIGSSRLQEEMEKLESKEAQKAANTQEKIDKSKPAKKLKTKLKLQESSKSK
jgi:curved DNA-binding protein CbpA